MLISVEGMLPFILISLGIMPQAPSTEREPQVRDDRVFFQAWLTLRGVRCQTARPSGGFHTLSRVKLL